MLAGCHDERMELDEEKLEALRIWGEKLGQTGHEENVAVGRAILMLVEEIDRLHIALWHARMQPRSADPTPSDATDRSVEEPDTSSLHARLHNALRRDAAAEPEEAEAAEADREASTWIAALRRQK